jgi:hypothetical protein
MSRNSLTKGTASNPNPPPAVPKRRRLRIGPAEINGMAELLARRLTETEAAGVLGIAPRSWFRWKQRQRNSGRFDALRETLTGRRIAAHLKNIEDGAVGAGVHKRADWRASKAVLEMADPHRFAGREPAPEPPRAPVDERTLRVWSELASLVHNARQRQQPGEVTDAEEVKALPERTETTPQKP